MCFSTKVKSGTGFSPSIIYSFDNWVRGTNKHHGTQNSFHLRLNLRRARPGKKKKWRKHECTFDDDDDDDTIKSNTRKSWNNKSFFFLFLFQLLPRIKNHQCEYFTLQSEVAIVKITTQVNHPNTHISWSGIWVWLLYACAFVLFIFCRHWTNTMTNNIDQLTEQRPLRKRADVVDADFYADENTIGMLITRLQPLYFFLKMSSPPPEWTLQALSNFLDAFWAFLPPVGLQLYYWLSPLPPDRLPQTWPPRPPVSLFASTFFAVVLQNQFHPCRGKRRK